MRLNRCMRTLLLLLLHITIIELAENAHILCITNYSIFIVHNTLYKQNYYTHADAY